MTDTRSHTFTWFDPATGAKAALQMSGMDYLQAMMRGEIPAPPIAVLMNMTLEEAEHGRAVFSAITAEYHYNPIGAVHGGFAATLLDSALGCSVQTTLPLGMGYTTLELHVNLVRPIAANTGKLLCEGKIIHAGQRIATAEARVTGANGKLYAHGTTTCLIFPVER